MKYKIGEEVWWNQEQYTIISVHKVANKDLYLLNRLGWQSLVVEEYLSSHKYPIGFTCKDQINNVYEIIGYDEETSIYKWKVIDSPTDYKKNVIGHCKQKEFDYLIYLAQAVKTVPVVTKAPKKEPLIIN
jgi:hypothetical protein